MKKSIIFLTSLVVATSVFGEGDTPTLPAYLDLLAARITENQEPMESAAAWNEGAPLRAQRLKRMLGLDPLPVRTRLNPQYVGEAVELETCTFRRVVFESAPGLYVAAHLYLPKGVPFPAPAMIYVPGHSRRDKYLPHALAYAAKGFVTIGLPMVGEEGRIDDDAGKCGHYGPYYNHFDWYSTGHTTAGAEVWDTMRAIDFLLSLETPDGKVLVDKTRIGMAGLSGGSARTFWATAVDSRIAAAVACQGVTTVSNYDATIPSTCDVHLFYNYYHQSFAEVYGHAAPRALRVIQATEDPLYKNPQPVADAMTKIYALIGTPERFSYVTFPGGHGYTPEVIASEQEWLIQWLQPETPVIPKISDADRQTFAKNRQRLTIPVNLQCFTGSREGWKLHGHPLPAKRVRELFATKTPVPTLKTTGDLQSQADQVIEQLKTEVLRHAFSSRPVKLQLEERNGTEALYERAGFLLIDGTLKHACRLFRGNDDSGKTVLWLVKNLEKKTLDRAHAMTSNGDTVLALEVTALNDKNLRRYAALVGHTQTSLVVNDALAGLKALRERLPKSSESMVVRARGDLAVAAIYAALVDPKIAGLILEDCPERLSPDTALLGILRHTTLAQSARLLYPRPVDYLGEVPTGFDLSPLRIP